MRKSFLSMLYGIAIEKGLIDINKILLELGIDENPSLTDQEKTASIKDLLMFRSGIFYLEKVSMMIKLQKGQKENPTNQVIISFPTILMQMS